jgi:glycosyltransferase involved in cell wall biosynthesis
MVSLAKQVKFSIIIPNYNKEEYVADTLNSIFNQTYKNFEVIVVDDASSDNSLEIIKNYDVKLLSTNRARAGGARNKGLDNATGDYIIFLDSDDYFTDNSVLERLNNLINDEDIIFLNYTRDKYGEIITVKEYNSLDIRKLAQSPRWDYRNVPRRLLA